MKKRFPFWILGLLGVIIVILVPALYFLGIRSGLAKAEPAPEHQASPLHPTFALLYAYERIYLCQR